jgi:hypothetical protein
MFRLDDAQGRQLTAIMLATRPDWAPRNPGKMLEHANTVGFLFAADYAHMIRALAVYATMPDGNGRPFGRSPDGYAKAGTHWTSTAPQDFEMPRGPRCERHRDFNVPCPCCRSEAIGERPEDPYDDMPADPRWLKGTAP